MDISVSLARWSLIPIFLILFNVKIKRDKHFKICSVSLIFVIFLRFFFFDYHDFPITNGLFFLNAICFTDAFWMGEFAQIDGCKTWG